VRDWHTDARWDTGGPVRDAGPLLERQCERPRPVDLLVVLDDSGSMTDRQELLELRLPEMLGELFRPADADGDGIEDRPRVRDFHVGVTSTSVDLDDGGCDLTEDGVLRRGEPAEFEHCKPAPYPPFLSYESGDDHREMLLDFNCLAFARRFSCQVEQPLEAMAHALLPADAPFEYRTGRAHGDGENAGFLRDDSLVAVLFISDEGDQSVLPGSVPDPGTPDAGLAPHVDRYLRVLEWLRPAERVVLGFLVNVGGAVVDPSRPSELCDPTGSPPGLLLEIAAASSSRTVAGSICRTAVPAFGRAFADLVAFGACAR
jgi:hypothetical protein